MNRVKTEDRNHPMIALYFAYIYIYNMYIFYFIIIFFFVNHYEDLSISLFLDAAAVVSFQELYEWLDQI